MTKAISLLSGGLDSLLATIVVKKQGIDVTALTFLTNFGCNMADTSSCSKDASSVAHKFGFTVKMCHLSEKFYEIVKNPRFGHGKNMNPCLDCRILMLNEAKDLMYTIGADFLITGEVLGQRPMSQRRDTFPVIDRETGLKGLVLRPLSAKLLKPTTPELKGLVDREKLYAFSGRSRKPQIALAQELGLTEYPNASGGCLLTDPIYSRRLRELLSSENSLDMTDINLLRLGRHFRVSPDCKIIVGRNQDDNEKIISYADSTEYLLRISHYPGPIALMRGRNSEQYLKTAASLCARYSKARSHSSVSVDIYQGNVQKENQFSTIEVKPAHEDEYESIMVK